MHRALGAGHVRSERGTCWASARVSLVTAVACAAMSGCRGPQRPDPTTLTPAEQAQVIAERDAALASLEGISNPTGTGVLWSVSNETVQPVEFKLMRARWSQFHTHLLRSAPEEVWVRVNPGEAMPFRPSASYTGPDGEAHLLVRARSASWETPALERYELIGSPPYDIVIRDSGVQDPLDPVLLVTVNEADGGKGLAVPVPRRFWPTVYGE